MIEKINQNYLLVFTGSLHSPLEPTRIRSILNQTTTDFSLIASQIFDNRYIWGRRHLFSAIWHAYNAEKNDQMISKTLSMEILLYTAGQRQIKKAIQLLGVKNNTKDVLGVLIGRDKSQLIKASVEIQKQLRIQINPQLLEDFSAKYQYLVQILVKDGFSAEKFTFEEIEKAILQKIAILALDS